MWTKEEIPEGWLECNGQPVPDSYPDLKALMPVTPNYQGRFLEGSATPGEVKEAGLPNIEGELEATSANEGLGNEEASTIIQKGAFRITKDHGGPSIITPQTTGWGNLIFDASLSNAIYGNSNTVQPPAVTVKYIIKAE